MSKSRYRLYNTRTLPGGTPQAASSFGSSTRLTTRNAAARLRAQPTYSRAASRRAVSPIVAARGQPST
jgi:hypothetical protein